MKKIKKIFGKLINKVTKKEQEIKYYLKDDITSENEISRIINGDKTIKIIIREKLCFDYRFEKIFYINKNFICFYKEDLETKIKLRGGEKFNFIKNIELKSNYISDVLLFSKNEFIFADENHVIG